MKNQDYKLHRFLVKHGAMRKFKRNTENEERSYQTELENGECDPVVISGAFIWYLTPEGARYWGKLDDLYQKSFD